MEVLKPQPKGINQAQFDRAKFHTEKDRARFNSL